MSDPRLSAFISGETGLRLILAMSFRFLVYLWLAQEHRRARLAVRISYQMLAEAVGVSKTSVQSAVSWLVRRKLLAVSKDNATATPRYIVLRPWREAGRRERSGGR